MAVQLHPLGRCMMTGVRNRCNEHVQMFILIDSKNYADAKGQENAANCCIPTENNFMYYKMREASPVMFLSIAQDFGPPLQRESLVNILGQACAKNSGSYRQIRVVLKGLGLETYQCLRENRSTTSSPHDVGTPMDIDDKKSGDDGESGDDGDKENEAIGYNDRTEATKFLHMLRLHKLDFLPTDLDDDVRLGTIDTCSATYNGDTPEQDEVKVGWRTWRTT